MTQASNGRAQGSRRFKKTLIALAIGGVSGFLGATLALRFLDADSMPDVGASVEIAVLVAMLYVLTGVAVGVGVLSPKMGAKFLNVEDAEELQEQRSMLAYSTFGMIGAGVALGTVALGGEAGVVDPVWALVIFAVLTVLAVWLSLKSLKIQDELMRAVGRETGALSFYLTVGIGGTWALLAHLGFTAAPQPLDWLTMFWSLMLVACFIIIGKRGMMAMR